MFFFLFFFSPIVQGVVGWAIHSVGGVYSSGYCIPISFVRESILLWFVVRPCLAFHHTKSAIFLKSSIFSKVQTPLANMYKNIHIKMVATILTGNVKKNPGGGL